MSWFPALSPDGTLVVGGNAEIVIARLDNGEVIADVGPGLNPAWLDASRIVYRDLTAGLWLAAAPAWTPQRISAVGVNALVAAGGHWAGFIAGAGSVVSDTQPLPIATACQPALNGTGQLAYLLPYQSLSRVMVLAESGAIAARGALVTCARGLASLAWIDGLTLYTQYQGATSPLNLVPGETRIAIVETAGGPWLVLQTQVGLDTFPLADPSMGFRFDNGGQAYTFTAVGVGTAILCVFTDQAGNTGHTAFDTTQPRTVAMKNRPAPAAPLVQPSFGFTHPVLVRPFAASGSGVPDLFTLGTYTEAGGLPTLTPGVRELVAHDATTDWLPPAGLRPYDLPLVEWYRVPEETIAQSSARWIRQTLAVLAAWPGDVGGIPMFYTQNRWTVAEVLEGLSYLSALVNLSPRLKVIAPFEYDRANGITGVPELQPVFAALLAAGRAAGAATLTPVVNPPPPPPPPPPKPVSDFLVITGVTMSLPQTVALVGPGALYASIDPHTKILTFDKTTAAGWETFELSKPDDRYMLRSLATATDADGSVHDASNLILSIDVTKFGSNDIRKLFALVDQSKRGNYESFFVGKTPNGLAVAFIEYINQGVLTKPFASPSLTVVAL